MMIRYDDYGGDDNMNNVGDDDKYGKDNYYGLYMWYNSVALIKL